MLEKQITRPTARPTRIPRAVKDWPVIGGREVLVFAFGCRRVRTGFGVSERDGDGEEEEEEDGCGRRGDDSVFVTGLVSGGWATLSLVIMLADMAAGFPSELTRPEGKVGINV